MLGISGGYKMEQDMHMTSRRESEADKRTTELESNLAMHL